MNKQKVCLICGKALPPTQKHVADGKRKYCSYECRRASTNQNYILHNPFKGTSTATTGAISELRVAVDLLSRGYDVFRALSPSCPCDLAILKEGRLLRIEVRTAHKSTSGKVYTTVNKQDDPNNIDHYAWVLPDEIMYEPELQ